jgi:hypothetical protein
VAAAVSAYLDIPAAVRQTLQKRIVSSDFDEIVSIGRSQIAGRGRFEYAGDIREMYFGKATKVCRTVSRAHWAATAQERGLVYCESGHCILVPIACGNISRVVRLPDLPPPPVHASSEPFPTPSFCRHWWDCEYWWHHQPPPPPIPEPGTWALMASGLALLALHLSRRNRRTGAPRHAPT